MQPTMVKIKLVLLSGMYLIILHRFPNKPFYLKRILGKTLTELQYVERSVLMKKINIQIFWTFEVGTQEGINVPIWIIVGFQQKERQDSQKLNNDRFFRPPVTSAQCLISTEKDPDSSKLLNYDDDNYSQGYAQIEEVFRVLTEDDIFQPYRSDNDIRSSNEGNDIGYKL